MALLQLSRIVAPNLWGWMADKSGKRVEIVRFGALMTCLMFISMFWQDTALGIGLVMLAFSFFWNAVLPQFEVITLEELGDKKDKYSQIRLWGSIGFIVTVVGIGALLDFISIRWLPSLMLILMICIWLNTLFIPKQARVIETEEEGVVQVLWRCCCGRKLLFFLLSASLFNLDMVRITHFIVY